MTDKSINIEEIKGRVSLLEIASQHVELHQRGKEWWGCCPFHSENSPSFHIRPDESFWKCFGCGTGGDVIEFVKLAHNVSFTEAVKILADGSTASCRQRQATSPPKSRTEMRWKKQLKGLIPLADTPGEEYLRNRGISLSANVKFHPDWYRFYWNQNTQQWIKRHRPLSPAVVFPIRNLYGNLVAVEGRYLSPHNPKHKIDSAGAKREGVFSTPGAFDQDYLIIVEGPFDALSLAECGFPAIATCGAINHPSWLAQACIGKAVWTAYDPNSAGDKGTQQLSSKLAEAGIQSKWLKPPIDGMDWNDALLEYGKESLSHALKDLFITSIDPDAFYYACKCGKSIKLSKYHLYHNHWLAKCSCGYSQLLQVVIDSKEVRRVAEYPFPVLDSDDVLKNPDCEVNT